MGGRAAWPTVRLTCGAGERCGAARRGHARDDIEQSADRRNGSIKVFIKNLQDVAHSSFELYPENSEDLIKTRKRGFLLFKAERGAKLPSPHKNLQYINC